MTELPDYDDIRSAAATLSGVANATPVLTSRTLDDQLGAQVFLKAENFQRVGAFKFRGAYNALSRFTDEQRARGVIAFSSGNHAQAIALAASLLDIPATIVMPHDAPASKLAATRGYGAKIVEYDRYAQDRQNVAAEIAAREGQTLIPPYDHPHIVAGQGTAADELMHQAGPLDAVFVCTGGGGLLAGSAIAVRGHSADTAIYGVEPEAGDDGRRSLHSGSLVTIDVPQTIADGAQTPSLGHVPFAIIREHVTDILAVSDTELVDCMRFYFERMRIVVEPTGCLSLAGVRCGAVDLRGKRVGVIISGGNVDAERFISLLSGQKHLPTEGFQPTT